MLFFFALWAVLAANSSIVLAQSTPTSCGYSSDAGAYGLVQIDPTYSIAYASATLYSYYGSGANAQVWFVDNGFGGWYPIATHTFTGTNTWVPWPNGTTYDQDSAEIYVYDGNSNTNAGTFEGYILSGTPSPECRYQVPSVALTLGSDLQRSVWSSSLFRLF